MFAAFLPTVSSSSKLAQNGPSKPSNRFSVRVFKTQPTPPFPYPVNTKVDAAYRPAAPREQQNANWYPSSNTYAPYDQRPRTTTNYAIYPSANNDTFIYEQSTCSKSDLFSNSELDSPTTDDFSPSSAFSPAMSTDSTITLPRTTIGDRSDDPRVPRSATPAPRPSYPSSGAPPPQSAVMMSRSTSGHHSAIPGRSTAPTTSPMRIPIPSTSQVDPMIHMAPQYVDIPEYAASTLSEMEVNERDLIAKRNAELNSTPTASFYSSSAGSAGSTDSDRRRATSTSQNPAASGRDTFARVSSSQPLHPNLHFPIRSQESEYNQNAFQANTSSAPTAFPSVRENSPPRVERLPSQLPTEVAPSQSGTQSTYSYASLPMDTWSRDATVFESEHPRSSMSSRTSPKNGTQTFDNTASGASSRPASGLHTTSAQQDNATFNDYRQDRAPTAAPLERSRSRRTSILGPRPDLSRPISEARDYGMPRAVPDPRQVDEYGQKRGVDPISSSSNSPPRGPADQITSRDASSRAADYRRDTRTPSPREREDDGRPSRVSRRDSYIPEPPRSSKDPRSKLQAPIDQREYIKSAPLSSSPTQLRSSPTETEPSGSRYAPQSRVYVPQESLRAPDRVRTRSISFSNSTRPPVVQVIGPIPPPPQPIPYPPGTDVRYASEYDRGHRTSPPRAVEPLRSTTPADYDRREPRLSASQGMYYNQTPPDYDSSARQNMPSSSRAIDKSASGMQTSYLRVSPTQEVPSSRSRAYTDSTHYANPHAEPVRRHSDGEKPFDSNIPLPRSNASHEKPSQQPLKVMNPSPPHTSPTVLFPNYDHPRRNSDGDQTPPLRLPLTGRSSAPLLRSVRWNENLVCPSPIPTSQRRKGWFNRRGDQLWTNDGAYKPAPVDQEYPPDLDEYPEQGEGWMNEECIRIDLCHRLIPKPPLRSALKQSKN